MKLTCCSGEVEVNVGDRFKSGDALWEVVRFVSNFVVITPIDCLMPAHYVYHTNDDGTLDFCGDSVAAAMLTKLDGRLRSARGDLLNF